MPLFFVLIIVLLKANIDGPKLHMWWWVDPYGSFKNASTSCACFWDVFHFFWFWTFTMVGIFSFYSNSTIYPSFHWFFSSNSYVWESLFVQEQLFCDLNVVCLFISLKHTTHIVVTEWIYKNLNFLTADLFLWIGYHFHSWNSKNILLTYCWENVYFVILLFCTRPVWLVLGLSQRWLC